jgi:hypothetical protein
MVRRRGDQPLARTVNPELMSIVLSISGNCLHIIWGAIVFGSSSAESSHLSCHAINSSGCQLATHSPKDCMSVASNRKIPTITTEAATFQSSLATHLKVAGTVLYTNSDGVDSRLSGWQETCSMQCHNRYIPH